MGLAYLAEDVACEMLLTDINGGATSYFSDNY